MAANHNGSPLLSDLCGICHNSTPKYKCPRCSARTCSLPCYKRHQQRAECSGKRDPAKYVKRSELVTAAGIDHDYNFISGIEKVLSRKSEVEKESRDGEGGENGAKSAAFYRRLNEIGVRVEKAPEVMSRSKQNRTRLQKKTKKIIWTVEWIDECGNRTTSDDANDGVTLSELYVRMMQQRAEKIDDVEMPSRKKRRHDQRALNKEVFSSNGAGSIPMQSPALPEDNTPPKLQEEPASEDVPQQIELATAASAPAAQDSPAAPKTGVESSPSHPSHPQTVKPLRTLYFYLLRPRSNSDRSVLIALTNSSTLFESLKGQTVLEFPTIYVLPHSPSGLPEQFLLEKHYLEGLEREQRELDDLLKKNGGARMAKVPGERKTQKEINEEEWTQERVVQAFRKDFESVG